MNQEDQIALIKDILLAIAPVITVRALKKANQSVDPYQEPPESFAETRAALFDEQCGYAIEIASRLAGKFATLHDAALAPQTQDSLAKSLVASARKQIAKDSASKVQRGSPGVST